MGKYSVLFLIAIFVAFGCVAQQQADSPFYSTKQSQWLSKRTGIWNVTMTLQPTRQGKTMVVNGLTAERTMIGALCLHEVMQPVKGAVMPLFTRTADLDYNLNDARWDYMSIDTRITGGLMYFTYFPTTGDSIVSYIMDFPHPGFGPEMIDRGKNVRCKNVVTTINENHDMVKQYWKLTDGEEWLAVIYDYTRVK